MEKKKVIEYKIDDDEIGTGVFVLSLVEYPAIEEDFVYFNRNQYVMVKMQDNEKRMIVAPAMIPNKEIYRVNPKTGEEYYVYFTPETVKQCAEFFLKNGNQKQISIDHNGEILDGITLVEQWVVEDSEKDKSAIYGYKLPVGTWMVSLKVENEQVWKMIKNEMVKGISIEGSFYEKFAALQFASKEEIDSAYRTYFNQINMSYSEVLKWAETEGSKSVGNRANLNRTLHLLNINKSDWGAKEVRWSKQLLSFINRTMLAEPSDKGNANMKNCGFNPMKQKFDEHHNCSTTECEHHNVLLAAQFRKLILDAAVEVELAENKGKKKYITVNQERWRTRPEEGSPPCPICLDLEEFSKDWVAKGTLPSKKNVHPKGWKAPASSCRCYIEYQKVKIDISE